MSTLTLYVGNDNVITLNGLIDSDGSYVNSATVVVTLVEANTLVEIVGESWPLTMTYIAASNGDYKATLADTLAISNGDELTAYVDADGGAGKHAYWEIPVLAETRTR